MSKIKLTESEIAMLDTIIAMKKEQQEGVKTVEVDEAELQFFKAAVARTVGKVAKAAWDKTPMAKEYAKGAWEGAKEVLAFAGKVTVWGIAGVDEETEKLKQHLEEKGTEELNLNQLIELRRVISERQKGK